MKKYTSSFICKVYQLVFNHWNANERSDIFLGDLIWANISRAEKSTEARTLNSKPLCLRIHLPFKKYIYRVPAQWSNPEIEGISKYGILDFKNSWNCQNSQFRLHNPSLTNNCHNFSVFLRYTVCFFGSPTFSNT